MTSHLYGRDGDRLAVESQGDGIVVVAGDSGIGKTRFLASLREGLPCNEDLVAEPITLGSVRGSLQSALADGIGDCLAQYTVLQPEVARALWEKVKTVTVRLVDATGRQAGSLLISRAFEFVESKIGKDAAGAIRSVLSDVLRPASASYEERLEALVVPDTATDLALITRQIAEHTGRRLVLLLDGGERLAADDRALLTELATALKESSVLVVVCVNSSTVEGAEVIRTTEGRDAYCRRIGALDRTSIYDWLKAEKVEQKFWGAVVHATSGYPLFIDDAIRLIRNGLPLTAIQSRPSFESLLLASWNALEPELQLDVMKLSGFADPPDDEFLGLYLGRTPLEWSVLRKRLISGGVFVSRTDGDEWFHERRRKYIWDEILTDNDRTIVASKALSCIRSYVSLPNSIYGWALGAMPSIVRQVSAVQRGEFIDNLLSLDRPELGLLWALLEVIDPNSQRGKFAETREVVRYAAIRAEFRSDPVAAIKRLVDLKMAHMAANEFSSIICPIIPDALANAALLGEIERTFEVRPIPRFATSVFETFARRDLEPFKSASISLQSGSLADHRNAMEELKGADGASRPLAHVAGLGVDLTVDGLPVTITTSFETGEQRNAARERVANRFASASASHVTLRNLSILPPARSHFGRFRELLRELDLGAAVVSAPTAASMVEICQQVAECLAIFRQHMSDEDASALDLTTPVRYLVEDSGWPESWAEFLVAGGSGRRSELIELDSDPPSLSDPLLELKLRARGLIDPEESIVLSTGHRGARQEFAHPLRRAVEHIEKRGRAFNRSLHRIEVPLDESELARLILEERRVAASIKAKLAAGLVIADRSEPHGSMVVIVSESKMQQGCREFGATCFEVSDDNDRVHVRITTREIERFSWGSSSDYLRSLGFECEERSIRRVRDGVGTFVLGPLLGYDAEDIEIISS